jgi:sporulation protein YlmC with PRC-barrel domain
MMPWSNLKYSDLRGRDVVDSKGENVGEIMDWIFDCTGNKLDLKYIVLGGGTIEEILESIGARPDIDPVIKLEDIESISDKVHLNVDGESLKKTLDPGVLVETDIPLSRLTDIKVTDTDGNRVGFVMDIWFDKDGVMWLVLGGGFFEELLERLKAQPDIDLLVPPNLIKTVDRNQIILSLSKSRINSSYEGEYKTRQRLLEECAPLDDADHPRLKLGSDSS